MAQSSYTIRAAALERLVDNIIPMFEKLRSSVIDETTEMDEISEIGLEVPFEGLEEMKRLYPNSGFAVAFFPTENLEVILQRLPGGLVPNAEPLESGACERLQSITTIIHMYHAFPQIHGKIETCYCLQKILTKSDEVFRKLQTTVDPHPEQALLGSAESRNKRGLEIKELSAWFYYVSQQLHGKTFNASVIFVKKTEHEFHPESDFAECTVNFVD